MYLMVPARPQLRPAFRSVPAESHLWRPVYGYGQGQGDKVTRSR